MPLKDEDIVIVQACRTPIGCLNGHFNDTPAAQLSSHVIKHIVDSCDMRDTTAQHISQVFMGQVLTAGCGPNPTREACLSAGVHQSVPCCTVNQVCGSGLRNVGSAYDSLRLRQLEKKGDKTGAAAFIIAGGQESMSKHHWCSLAVLGTRAAIHVVRDSDWVT